MVFFQSNLILRVGIITFECKSFIRFRHFYKNMTSSVLQPPEHIRGMKVLDKSQIRKEIQVPVVCVQEMIVNKVMPFLKTKLLKIEKLRPVQDHGDSCRAILLHPLAVTDWNDLPTKELLMQGVTSDTFKQIPLKLSYENWRSDELLKFILPIDQEGITSFSRIGHIIHLNLKDHLLEYKAIIAEILRDKTVGVRTVVNKVISIDNTYRNFSMELLIGEPDYQVTVKENGITFEFDFSLVYWNPRLSMEHERIVNLLKEGDVLYDIFAGVGPFSIPAAKHKKVQVYANDLNPESYKSLKHNVKKNKVEKLVQTFNKDGREFIMKDVKEDLLKRLKDPETKQIHLTMNLPALAVEFLDIFVGLFREYDRFDILKPAIVHVYCFAKGSESKEVIALKMVEENLGLLLKDSLIQINFVRNVAPNKDMMRVDFALTSEILFSIPKIQKRIRIDDCCESNSKKSTSYCAFSLKLFNSFLFSFSFSEKSYELNNFNQQKDGETLTEEIKATGSKASSYGQEEKRNEGIQTTQRHG